MNLFARILSHGFALVVVALLAIGLIYRGELFPEWNLPETLSIGHERGEAGTERQADAGKAKEVEQMQPGGGERAAVMPVPEEQQTPSAAIDRGETGMAGAAISAQQETEHAVTAMQPAAGAADTGAPATAVPGTAEETIPETAVQETTEETAPAPAAALEAGETGAPAGVAAPEVPAPQTGAVLPGVAQPEAAHRAETALPAEAGAEASTEAAVQRHAAPAATPYKILAAAREAYWLRDYAVAELKYEELIAMDPDNPDGYGELGNMYFSQGDWNKASASYYEAGVRLAAQGMFDRAKQLVEVIRGLNGGQADDLERQINAAESAAP